MVPFVVRLEENAADKTMSEKLASEHEGILNWCIQGCLAWQARGLNPPKCVVDATQDYRSEQDVIGAFISECVLVDERVRIKASELYAAYVAWVHRGPRHIATYVQLWWHLALAVGFQKGEDRLLLVSRNGFTSTDIGVNPTILDGSRLFS